jgi:hypothetical protein
MRSENAELLESPSIVIVIGSPGITLEGEAVITTADTVPAIPAQRRITTVTHDRRCSKKHPMNCR